MASPSSLENLDIRALSLIDYFWTFTISPPPGSQAHPRYSIFSIDLTEQMGPPPLRFSTEEFVINQNII
ncbi:hypothetical protein PG994_002403 [Apiospora phragmitis]|uniref:Uncharacterized protein n=1 Tax=Apiospora phragmitis TaxID=2905665 RepID=A0ABR1WWA1_9PEZI